MQRRSNTQRREHDGGAASLKAAIDGPLTTVGGKSRRVVRSRRVGALWW
jgi:hypothetical protein